jgi:hypothetical protein
MSDETDGASSNHDYLYFAVLLLVVLAGIAGH